MEGGQVTTRQAVAASCAVAGASEGRACHVTGGTEKQSPRRHPDPLQSAMADATPEAAAPGFAPPAAAVVPAPVTEGPPAQIWTDGDRAPQAATATADVERVLERMSPAELAAALELVAARVRVVCLSPLSSRAAHVIG